MRHPGIEDVLQGLLQDPPRILRAWEKMEQGLAEHRLLRQRQHPLEGVIAGKNLQATAE